MLKHIKDSSLEETLPLIIDVESLNPLFNLKDEKRFSKTNLRKRKTQKYEPKANSKTDPLIIEDDNDLDNDLIIAWNDDIKTMETSSNSLNIQKKRNLLNSGTQSNLLGKRAATMYFNKISIKNTVPNYIMTKKYHRGNNYNDTKKKLASLTSAWGLNQE